MSKRIRRGHALISVNGLQFARPKSAHPITKETDDKTSLVVSASIS
jgi:hypothetical protein